MKSQSFKYSFSLLILLVISSPGYSQNNDDRIFNDSIVKISEIGTNSIHSDFGPSVISDSLFFTTFNDNLVAKTDWMLRNKEFYDLYRAKTDKNGEVISKRVPVEEFITRFNDGPVAWCPTTGELFITQNYLDQSAKLKPFANEINHLKIIIAKRKNGKWEKVADFPYNNPEFSVGHPAVTTTGDTLIFSSDRTGGFGETDLYISVRKKGKWGIPVNLGSQINTSGKEEFTFLTDHHFNGQYLIFASKGRFGSGGFDLYYTKFPSDFSEIGHFESPINTKDDDFAMTIPLDAEYGYLTSNRPGTGSDDIYKFTFKRPDTKLEQPLGKCREVYVYDQTSRRPIPGVRIVSCDMQIFITDAIGKIPCLPCNGNRCELTASTFGYPVKTKILAACTPNARDTIWMDILTNQQIVLRNIYYDFDKWDILPDAAKELDQLIALMKENPEMKVELSSHTDIRGTEQYNMKLSQLRAESAVDYIVSKGIDRSRIFGRGFGKTQLIHRNLSGQKLSPTENRENRRTEIFIPGFLRGEPVKQDKGDYSNGRPDAAAGYSSFREHGSLPDNSAIKIGSANQDSAEKKESKTENHAIKTLGKTDKSQMIYIILGSFKGEKSAAKLINELKAQGLEPTLLGKTGAFRVGIGYEQPDQAKKALKSFKNKYPTAWIQQK